MVNRCIRRFELPVTGGIVCLSFPDPINEDELIDVNELLAFVVKGMARRAIPKLGVMICDGWEI